MFFLFFVSNNNNNTFSYIIITYTIKNMIFKSCKKKLEMFKKYVCMFYNKIPSNYSTSKMNV